MSVAPDIHIFASAEQLQEASAHALIHAIEKALSQRGQAHIVLTGGSNGIGLLTALAQIDTSINWSQVHFYFGDERFVPLNHPERNAGQAEEAFLRYVPTALVYPMPASDQGLSLEQAAQNYAELLINLGNGDIPQFDIHLFGMGDEGHINSLFPYSQATSELKKYVVPVTDSPKPPAERVTLTFPAIKHAREAWLLVSGAAKAEAVQHAVTGANELEWPAAGAQGNEKTVWFLDSAAANKLQL